MKPKRRLTLQTLPEKRQNMQNITKRNARYMLSSVVVLAVSAFLQMCITIAEAVLRAQSRDIYAQD
jgi:hypothetical protein